MLEQASIANPHDKELLGAYGRALADVGRYEQALEVLSRAHTPDQPDWRILNVQGAVLDQLGRHDEARRHYASALKIMPDEPSVLSNLGLSYALSKDLKRAEDDLRQARARSRTPLPRRGRTSRWWSVCRAVSPKPRQIARADLPPDEAAANVAYLRQMLAQQNERSKTERTPAPQAKKPKRTRGDATRPAPAPDG